MLTHPARSRTLPAVAALGVALALGACDSDPIAPDGPPDPPSAPEPEPAPAPDVPTTDAAAGLDPADFTNIDRDTEGAPADAPTLTAAEVAELEASALEETGHDTVMAAFPTTVTVDGADTFAWELTTFGTEEVAYVHVEGPGEEPLGSQTGPLSGAAEGLQDATQRWSVGLSEAVDTALEVRPGEVVGTGSTNDIDEPLMAIAIRQDDGTAVRVVVDGETGEPLVAVELGGSAQDGGGDEPQDHPDIPTDQHDIPTDQPDT